MKCKYGILTSFLLFISASTFAQGVLQYTIEVFDIDNKPVIGLKIVLEETTTGKKVSQITDKKGLAFFTISEGKNWWVHVGEMKKMTTLNIPENGNASGKHRIPYDPESMSSRESLPDRNKLNLNVIEQNNIETTIATDNNAIIIIELVDNQKKYVKHTPVALTSIETNKKYTSITDIEGKAHFMVPVGYLYYIDVDQTDYYQKIDLPKSMAGYTTTIKVKYQPSQVVEKNINDTIFQKITKDAKNSATRAFTTIKVKNISGDMLKNELVFVKDIGSSLVYKSLTDDKGEARFLLPLHKKYLISFEFEPDVDVIDLDAMYGNVSNVEYELTYRPIPRLANPGKFIPTPEQLFLTEFHNFIDKQWPQPKNDRLVDVIFSWGNKVNEQSKEAVLELNIVMSKTLPDSYKRPAINICFVLDVSGSMMSDLKIDSLKSALNQFIKKLHPNDLVSLVIFNSEAGVLLSSRKKGDGYLMYEYIEKLTASGGTNIYKGLLLGHNEVKKNLITDGVNRLILLSDGYGITEPKIIIDKAQSFVKEEIEITAIGVGEYYNYALMSHLATLSGSLMHFVGDADDMSNVFENELSALLLPAAEDFQLEIEYNNQIVFKQLLGFPFNEQKPIAKMEIPHLYAGMTKLAMVKFDLIQPSKEIEQYPVILRFSYYDPVLKAHQKFEEKAYLEWSPYTGKMELILEHEKRKLYAIAIMNQSIKVMADAFEAGNYKEAKLGIENCIRQIEELYPDAKDQDLLALFSKLKLYSNALNQKIINENRSIKKHQKN